MGLAGFNMRRRQMLEQKQMLEHLTVAELRKLATKKGVKDINKKNKQQLVMEMS